MKTVECSLAQLRPELNQQITAQLHGDQNLLACCETKEVEFQGGKPSYAYVITPRQIIQAWTNPKQRKTGAYSIFLSDIISIGEGKDRKTGFAVWMRTHEDLSMQLYFETEQGARKFASTLRSAMSQAKAAVIYTPASPADRLRSATQMHQEGPVTDAEFAEKRKEILGQL